MRHRDLEERAHRASTRVLLHVILRRIRTGDGKLQRARHGMVLRKGGFTHKEEPTREELKHIIENVPKKDLFIIQDDLNSKVGTDDWVGTEGHLTFERPTTEG
ncbi:hypothetical protein DPMN_165883 [Dreissena polymorpha]|uniref:Uncharacterized protein n=1 Tax=Dreissena polymorpha TaxID=45954 RepID=A0A9D4EY07_DREPO|nr:hypothetical protein DPMN_165883 [Dreissena polymorpha]